MSGSEPLSPLMTVLGLEEREHDVFVGKTPDTTRQTIFGGQVAGQALMAAGRTVPGDRPAHSLHSYFLRAGDPNEEIRYTVERIRDGRAFTTRRVTARQYRKGEDVEIFTLAADFTAGEAGVAEHCLPMPTVPEPGPLPSLADALAAHPDRDQTLGLLSQAVEMRFLEDPFEPGPKSPPDTQTRIWMRVDGRLPDAPGVHPAALTFASDLTLLSAALTRLGTGWGGFVGASLDHSVWFHRPVRADDWFLYETDSPVATAGRALCFGQIWSADGRHVATVAQEGLIRSLDG